MSALDRLAPYNAITDPHCSYIDISDCFAGLVSGRVVEQCACLSLWRHSCAGLDGMACMIYPDGCPDFLEWTGACVVRCNGVVDIFLCGRRART